MYSFYILGVLLSIKVYVYREYTLVYTVNKFSREFNKIRSVSIGTFRPTIYAVML